MWVQCPWDEWQWVSLSQTAPPGIPGDLLGVILALPGMGLPPGGPYFPIARGTFMDTKGKTKDTESSSPGTATRVPAQKLRRLGQLGGIQLSKEWVRLPWLGGERPLSSSTSLENVEGLTEKVGTLGLQITNKNRCGATKKWAKRAGLAKAPSGDKADGQPRTAPGGQPQTSQEPSTSGVQGKPAESKGPLPGPSKRQRLAGGTPEGGMLRGPSRLGNLAMPELLGRASGWQLSVKGIRTASTPKKTLQISSERSADLWTSSLRRGWPPSWLILIGQKGRP